MKPYKWFVIILIAVSLVGFFDASYLTAKHYTGGDISCSVLDGCEQVTTSEYSTVLGVPIALIGAVFYLVISTLLIIYYETTNLKVLWLVIIGTAGGFLFSGVLVYIQVVIIGALCLYCLISATTSTALFAGGLYLLKLSERSQGKNYTDVK